MESAQITMVEIQFMNELYFMDNIKTQISFLDNLSVILVHMMEFHPHKFMI
jgi:hypothetical protein